MSKESQRAKVSIAGIMGASMLVILRMGSNMGKESGEGIKRTLQISMRANINLTRNTAKGNSLGQVGMCIKGNIGMMREMVRVK
jgi:hypothetical protein